MIVDFHTHILPGIDDGSRSVEMSGAMLQIMRDQGTTHCVATPHFFNYRQDIDEFTEKREQAFQALKAHIADSTPQIILGAEVSLFTELAELADDDLDKLCIEGTKTLLLELPYAQWSEFEVNIVVSLCVQRGYNVILAHWERYAHYQGNHVYEERLLELPIFVQVNAGSLQSIWKRRKILDLLSNGRAHLLGSDCHDLSHRPPNLLQGRNILEKHLGPRVLQQMDDLGADLLGIRVAKRD